jgi:hypothetical protein
LTSKTCEHIERVVCERGLGRRAEQARVVDEQVDAAELGRRGDQSRAVCAVGDIAGNGAHDARHPERFGRGAQCGRIAGVDDEVPALARQRAGEGPAETTGGAGDDCDGHEVPPRFSLCILVPFVQ